MNRLECHVGLMLIKNSYVMCRTSSMTFGMSFQTWLSDLERLLFCVTEVIMDQNCGGK